MKREPVPPTPRKSFTRAQMAQAFSAAEGRCERCKAKITGDWHIDHIIEITLGGAHDPSNWRVLCVPCHKDRTSKRAPELAKVNRLIANENPETRRKSPRPLKGGKALQSRGFDERLRKKMDGTVERRDA